MIFLDNGDDLSAVQNGLSSKAAASGEGESYYDALLSPRAKRERRWQPFQQPLISGPLWRAYVHHPNARRLPLRDLWLGPHGPDLRVSRRLSGASPLP